MKNMLDKNTRIKILILLFISIIYSNKNFSQIDTLHLYYKGLDNKVPDTTEAKIVAWAKNLNGKHVDIKILAYYSQADFKKVATDRADEMFLVMNRKARSLITIKTYEAQKGTKSQRSLVDVIYTPTESTVTAKPTNTVSEKKENTVSNTGNQEPVKQINKPFVVKEEFKSRKLILVLLSENKTELERLGKKVNTQGIDAYKKGIKTYNDNITSAFKKHWTVFETVTEADLASGVNVEQALNSVYILPGKKQSAKLNFVNCKVAIAYRNGKTLDVNTSEFKVSIPDGPPQEADFMVLIHKIKVFYGVEKEFDRTQLEEILGTKTLYVDTALTEIPEIEFKDEYTFPVKLTDAKTISDLINKKDNNTLYLKPDVYTGVINLVVTDASNGAIYSRGTLSGLVKPTVKMPEGVFGASGNMEAVGSDIKYKPCSACSFGIMDQLDLYTIPKGLPKIISNEKKQTVFNPLIGN